MVDETMKHVLRVRAERDPGVVSRVLERFANLNLIPVRFNAVCDAKSQIVIEIDLAGISCATLSLIVGKIGQLPAVFDTVLEDVELNIYR